MTKIMNKPHKSNYFQGAYAGYGRYQWDLKYYDWKNDYEPEDACNEFFGIDGEHLSAIVKRPLKVWMDGRSGGWLVIDTELTENEQKQLNSYIDKCFKMLPKYLKQLRVMCQMGI